MMQAPDVVEAFPISFKNYASFYEDRYLQVGSISKMALIIKAKLDGSVKRRIIVDLRRSGAVLYDGSTRVALEAFETAWDAGDTASLGLVIGDCAPQALSELCAILLAVVVWRIKLGEEGFCCQVRSGSTAAPSATGKLARIRPRPTTWRPSWLSAWKAWVCRRWRPCTCRGRSMRRQIG